MHLKILRLLPIKSGAISGICTVCLLFITSFLLPAQTFAASNRFSVVSRPTITAAGINSILCQNHSPACGTGQSLYNLGIKYGINPAVALAFFNEESTFGRFGVAAVTHSLGNIRCTPGYKCISGFRAYHTWVQGYQDWYRLIRYLYVNTWHLTTIPQIIARYAPSSENSTSLYIRNVEQFVKTH
jgi:Mannosyl-glycoprotein endo-beta-N-acetylglucosaminidase